jgi:DEAD/DEAH box helicase domain-containing protein
MRIRPLRGAQGLFSAISAAINLPELNHCNWKDFMSDSYILVRCKTHNRGQNPLPYRLQQYSKDSSGRLAVRELTKAGDEIIAGGWSYSPRPFQPGIYCAHCLADGKREPLDIDELDMKEAGVADTPLVFQIAKEFSAQEALEILQSRFAPSIRLAKILPAVEGRVVPDSVLSQVHSGLQQAIRSKITNGNGLFEFQSRAIELALQRKDLIVTTPTASGKSLTYVVPILDRLLKDQTATALYLSPLTALTSDQLDAISRLDSRNTDWVEKAGTYSIHASLRKVWFDNGAVEVARYDGQVLQGDRDEIRRRQPQWLMTTPDMLHWGLLRNAFSEKTWGYFFKNLSIVVIDEMHTYRGLLGASFANLMRRLERICHKYGVVPQFISTSATIVEPAATMQRLTGRWPMVVDGDNRGAPQTERAFVMMAEPPAEETPRQLSTQAKDMLLHFMKERVRTLAFSRSIDEINTVYRFTKAELKGLGMSNVELTPFKAELNPADKKVTG